jgi:Tol biopolymer transport system component
MLSSRHGVIGHSTRRFELEVRRMRADGSDPQPLTSDLEADHGPPTWSPDGRYLLYHRFPLRGPDVTIAVWIMDVATQQTWEVARPGQRPQWIP